MSFVEELNSREYSEFFLGTPMIKCLPKGARQFDSWVKDIVDNDRKVFIDPDADPDGYFSAKIIETMFKAVRFSNYSIASHVYKRHVLNMQELRDRLVNDQFDYYIVVDSSSNSYDMFELFKHHPTKRLVVIDHHKSETDRSELPSNVLLINPKLDTLEKGTETPLVDLSAGAICSLLVDMTIKLSYPDYYDNLNSEHMVYGYVTLYSDCCKFSLYNISYARKVTDSNYPLPKILDIFKTKWDCLCRSFISFKVIPRINALIRSEQFKLVWDLFFDTETFIAEDGLAITENTYKKNKTEIQGYIRNANVTNNGEMVFAVLENMPRARNYTGLIASELVSQYQMPAMVVMQTKTNLYEGSVRDLYSRDLLSSFKLICKADGHGPAFGLSFPITEFDNIKYSITDMCKDLEKSQIIFIDWTKYISSDEELKNDIAVMAEYNEYAGQGLPEAYGVLKITNAMTIRRFEKMTRIKWGSRELIVFGNYVSCGDTVYVAPSYPGPQCIIKSVKYDNI